MLILLGMYPLHAVEQISSVPYGIGFAEGGGMGNGPMGSEKVFLEDEKCVWLEGIWAWSYDP